MTFAHFARVLSLCFCFGVMGAVVSSCSTETEPPASARPTVEEEVEQEDRDEAAAPQRPVAERGQRTESAVEPVCGALCDAGYWETATVESLMTEITLGADPSAVDADGNSPLHLAARHGQDPGLIVVLLDHGAFVNTLNAQGSTPLHRAAWRRDPRIARVLLEYGAESNLLDDEGHTPLQIAAALQHREVVEVMLELGAGVDDRGHDGWTALHHAVSGQSADSPDVALLLLSQGANPDLRTNGGERACDLMSESLREGELHTRLCGESVAEGQEACRTLCDLSFWERATRVELRRLLDSGEDPTLSNADGDTPLHLAALANRDPEVLAMLIEAGADIESRTVEDGYTPVGYAIWANNRVAAQALLDAGANPTVKLHDGRTPLHLAAARVTEPHPLTLLHSESTEQLEQEQQQSSLEIPNTIRLLLDFGASINETDYYGHNALDFAAIENNLVGIELLLEYGADIDRQGHDGWTALHHAARFGAADAVLILIEMGADTQATTDAGEAACELADESLLGTGSHTALCDGGSD